MGPLMPFRAEELLDKGRMALKTIRAKLFLGSKFHGKSEDFSDALLEFCVMFSLVQNLRDWSKLSEPGLAGLMMGEEVDSESLEQAREIDRQSIETHARIAREFEDLGGRAEFQRRIDRLNEIALAEGVESRADRAYYEDPDFDLEDDFDDFAEDEADRNL